MMNRLAVTILFGVPLLVALAFLGCFSYPYFWDHSNMKPKDNDLVGSYRPLELRLPDELKLEVKRTEARITLNADHTATLADVPEFDGFGEKLECRLTGSATWKLDDKINDGWGWSVAFQNYHSTSKLTSPNCKYENFIWGVLILNRHVPYRLYDIVGDPDSDTGVEYERLK